MEDGPTIQQNMALVLEIQTAIKLLRLGLGELQSIDGANDFYHLPLQLLSSGFERLMKCMICLKQQSDTGQFPSTKELITHDLLCLKDRVLSECISEDTASSRPATKADYSFMKTDEDLRRLLEMISEFGKYARYYNLDVVTGSSKPSVDVEQMWGQFETELVGRHKEIGVISIEPSRTNDLYCGINRIIIGTLQRFARALVRQFTLGDLGDEAKVHTGSIGCFLSLMDEDLSRIEYRPGRCKVRSEGAT